MIDHFKDPTKDINLNDFIDAETLFDGIKSKEVGFEDLQKKSNRVWIEIN